MDPAIIVSLAATRLTTAGLYGGSGPLESLAFVAAAEVAANNVTFFPLPTQNGYLQLTWFVVPAASALSAATAVLSTPPFPTGPANFTQLLTQIQALSQPVLIAAITRVLARFAADNPAIYQELETAITDAGAA